MFKLTHAEMDALKLRVFLANDTSLSKRERKFLKADCITIEIDETYLSLHLDDDFEGSVSIDMPFSNFDALPGCCGIGLIFDWCKQPVNPLTIAAFKLWVQGQAVDGYGILTTSTNQHQSDSNKLLQAVGFEAMKAHNYRSGNDIFMWSLVLNSPTSRSKKPCK